MKIGELFVFNVLDGNRII